VAAALGGRAVQDALAPAWGIRVVNAIAGLVLGIAALLGIEAALATP
jgi:hypothetical protein